MYPFRSNHQRPFHGLATGVFRWPRCVAALCLICATAAKAQTTTFTLERSANPTHYTPGQSIDITLTLSLTTSDQVDSIGTAETVPAGWTYNSIVSGTAPSVTPNPGDGGELDFAWFPAPSSFPITFTYRLDTPAAGANTQSLSGAGDLFLRTAGEVMTTNVTSLIPQIGAGPFHTADQDLSDSINLNELLRVVQLYNAGGLHCADAPGDTEDGYESGALGNKSCGFHNSDYNPADWRIDLNELLRLIQIYNAGNYHACADGEDKFCTTAP